MGHTCRQSLFSYLMHWSVGLRMLYYISFNILAELYLNQHVNDDYFQMG